MNRIERWLPFKFSRKEKQEEKRSAGASEKGGLSSASSSRVPVRLDDLGSFAMPPLLAAPMQQLMRQFWGEPAFSDPFGRYDQMERWFGDYSPTRFAPSVEVSDEVDAIRVTAELPGMSAEDVNLQIRDNLLIIAGEKKSQTETNEQGVFRTERYFGHFQRAVPLPEDVDTERADAKFDKGILSVRLPKTERVTQSGRNIPINS